MPQTSGTRAALWFVMLLLAALGFLWLAFVVGNGHMSPSRLEGLAADEAPSMWFAGLQALVICGAALVALHALAKHKSSLRSGWF